jgi:hypothetical protein
MGILFAVAGVVVCIAIGLFTLNEGMPEYLSLGWFAFAVAFAIWGVWDAISGVLSIKDAD